MILLINGVGLIGSALAEDIAATRGRPTVRIL
jgi:predicted dinucleotide-binding enzyme